MFCWPLPGFQGILAGAALPQYSDPGSVRTAGSQTKAHLFMSILKTIVPKPETRLISPPQKRARTDTRQRELLVGSLCLLLLALSIVLWHDRDFWFPDTIDEAETDQPVQSSPAAIPAPKHETAVAATEPAAKPVHRAIHASAKTATATPATPSTPQPAGPVIATTQPYRIAASRGRSSRRG